MARQIVGEPLAFGSAWPILGVAAALSTLVASRFGAATHPRRVWIVCNLLMATGVVAPLVVPGLAGILIAAVLVGATVVTITLSGLLEARRLDCAARRPVISEV